MAKPINLNSPDNWDLAAEGYANYVAPFLMESYSEEFVDRLRVAENASVLEVAAGSGALTVTLAKHVKSVLATDFSPKMVAILRNRLNEIGITNVEVEEMDGQALTLEDASFDGAACNFGLMLFTNREKGFSELRRVLRPGGRAVITGWAGPDKNEALGFFTMAVQKTYPEMPPPPTPPPVFSLANPSDFKTQMEQAGFQDVEVDFATRKLEVKNFDEFWRMLTVGAPPIRELFAKVGQDGISKLRDTLAKILEERFGSGSITTTNTATIGTGTVRS